MGYARYDTPLGPAGYSVPDTCHEEDCAVIIDRGLSYLCGRSPGREDESGCGQWFCAEHLCFTGEPGLSQCVACGMAHLVENWE